MKSPRLKQLLQHSLHFVVNVLVFGLLSWWAWRQLQSALSLPPLGYWQWVGVWVLLRLLVLTTRERK